VPGAVHTESVPGAPATVVSPTTMTKSQVPATSLPATSAPIPTAGAKINNAPVAALIAGVFGAVALL
jgi:hypothetical protein